MRAWARYITRGILPFPLTLGERVFLGVLQVTDAVLVWWAIK